MHRLILIAFLFPFTLSAVAAESMMAPTTGVKPQGHPTGMRAAMMAAEAGPMIKATVVSSIDIPQFTYLQVKQGERLRWLASASVAVKEGDLIEFEEDSTMANFTSKTLNRTFDSLTFVNSAHVVKR